MSLLNELQLMASSPASSTLDVLRKGLLLSAKVNDDTINNWIVKELNGYSKDDELPDHRVFNSVVYCDVVEQFRHGKGLRLEYPKIIPYKFPHPISTIDTIAKSNDEFTRVSLPIELDEKLHSVYSMGYPGSRFEFYTLIHRSTCADSLEICKTKILEWAIQLEKDGKIDTKGETFLTKKEPLISIVNNNQVLSFYGKHKRAIWVSIAVFVLGCLGSVWWNWTADYTKDDVKPLFDSIREHIEPKPKG